MQIISITPLGLTRGPTPIKTLEDRMPLAGTRAVLAAGRRELTAYAVGGACGPAVLAGADSAGDILAEAVSVAFMAAGGNKGRRMRKAQSHGILPLRVWVLAMLPVLFLGAASCNQQEKARVVEREQKTFASPADAGAALFDAAKSGDRESLLSIFGPDGEAVLFTGDAVKDREGLKDFATSYSQMHRWVNIKAGGAVLNIGADNHLFPVPLGQNSTGAWYFDTPAGQDEILARRIGRGELTAITASGAIADAERQYFSQTHDGDAVKQYTLKFVSDPDKQNGLYWAVPEDQPASPLGTLVDLARSLGNVNTGGKPQPFNGYYFRILTKQGDKAPGGAKDYLVNGKMTGGFAILAYPVEYRNTGIMTFITGPDGIVYQKDLGEQTPDEAGTMTVYNPGDGWSLATRSPSTTG